MPYGQVGSRNGRRYQFGRGSIVWDIPLRVKLLAEHHPATRIGKIVELTDTDEGLHMRASLDRTFAALRMVARSAVSGKPKLSIGLADDLTGEMVGDIWHCVYARLVEISLTPNPVFEVVV